MYDNHKTSNYDFTKIPFNDIISFGQRTLLYRDLFTVSWLLGRYCNYRCSYCWPFARSDTKDHRPTEVCISTIDEIKKQARNNSFNSFHFSFSGGEPTFHPGYLDILKHLANDISNTNYTSIHMTSNCSRPIKWFEKYIEYSKPFHRANITASLHTEHVNTKVKMQELADKLILCQQNDIQVTINMVMVPEKFDEYYDNALFIHKQGINVTLKAQTDPTSSFVVSGYTTEQLAKLRNGMPQLGFTQIKKTYTGRPRPKFIIPKNDEPDSVDHIPLSMQVEFIDKNNKKWYMDQAERFNAFGFNKFKGWLCNSGYQGIIIREPDGTVKRSYGCIDVPLGHIETGFELFKKPKICISDTCTSSADSKIPKRKII